MKLDQKILGFLYEGKNDGNYHVLIDHFKMEYENIIGPIEDLVSTGLVKRRYNETLGMFEDPDPKFDSTKTNTECKITQAGILYYEKTRETRFNRILSVIAIIISIGTLIFTVLDRLCFTN